MPKHISKSMKEAHERLLSCFDRIKMVKPGDIFLGTTSFEIAYRDMVDAIRDGSAWLEQGKGTQEERESLKKDQIMVEDYVANLGIGWDHPWQKGN